MIGDPGLTSTPMSEQRANEIKGIGRFIRARRQATDASSYDVLPTRRRHVPYLTQEDLAELLQVSSVVISQIEQGRYPNLNDAMLRRIAQALNFTFQQETYLLGMARPRSAHQRGFEEAPDWVVTSVESVAHPTLVINPAYDLIVVNEAAKVLLGPLSREILINQNSAISIFQLHGLTDFIVDWRDYAASLVSGLKMSYAIFLDHRDYIDQLAAHLESEDATFRELWSQPDPLLKPTLEKEFRHPVLGEIRLLQILTDLWEAKPFTKIEFFPADDETREKMRKL